MLALVEAVPIAQAEQTVWLEQQIQELLLAGQTVRGASAPSLGSALGRELAVQQQVLHPQELEKAPLQCQSLPMQGDPTLALSYPDTQKTS